MSLKRSQADCGDSGGIIVFIILALVVVCGGAVCWLLGRRCKNRKEIRDAIPIEEEAIPPAGPIDEGRYFPCVSV
jgi:hypothetical protein